MFLELLLQAEFCAKDFGSIVSFNYCPHFTDEEAGTWGKEGDHPKTSSWGEAESRYTIDLSDPRA